MLLEPAPLADSATADAVDLAASLAGRRIVLAAGERLWPEGALPDQVLFVESGLVTLHWNDRQGDGAEVDAAGAGEAIGLPEALARRPRAFEARAALPTTGLLASADALRQRVEQDPAAATVAWSLALDRLTQSRRAAGCAVRHGARQRLADHLLLLHRAAEGGRLSVTQEGLGAVLGVYRTTVTALLAEFVEEGLVEAGRGRLAVRDPMRLARAACGCRRGVGRKVGKPTDGADGLRNLASAAVQRAGH